MPTLTEQQQRQTVRTALYEQYCNQQLTRINNFQVCCNSLRDRDHELFGWQHSLDHDSHGRPYYDWQTYEQMLSVSYSLVDECDTIKSLVEKMINYTLGTGVTYKVQRKNKPISLEILLDGLTSDSGDQRRANRRRSRFPSQKTFDASDIREMNAVIEMTQFINDWPTLQEEGLWQKYKGGEQDRRISRPDDPKKFREIDVLTAFQIRPPVERSDSLTAASPSTTNRPEAKYGIEFRDGKPFRYHIRDEGATETSPWDAKLIQQSKYGSQMKNPRGVPPFFIVRNHAMGKKQIEFGYREMFLARAANAVVWQHDYQSANDGNAVAFLDELGLRNQDLKTEAVDRSSLDYDDDENAQNYDRFGNPLPAEVHTHAKVTYPSPNMGADEIEILIALEERPIGNVVCMTDFLTQGTTGDSNNNNLQEASDPVVKRTMRERRWVAEQDVEMFWRILQIWFDWDDITLLAAQMQIEIVAEFPPIVREDLASLINGLSIGVQTKIFSKKEARRQLNLDSDTMEREIETEKRDEEQDTTKDPTPNIGVPPTAQLGQARLDQQSANQAGQTPATPQEDIQGQRPQGENSNGNGSAQESYVVDKDLSPGTIPGSRHTINLNIHTLQEQNGEEEDNGQEQTPAGEENIQEQTPSKPIHKKSSIDKLAQDENTQSLLAEQIDGAVQSGTSPVDVITVINGIEHGISVLTMQDNQSDRIRLSADSRRRKESWGKEIDARRLYTVVVDRRGQASGNGDNSLRIYYRESLGSFDLKDMEELSTFSEVKDKLEEASQYEYVPPPEISSQPMLFDIGPTVPQ